jgi:hypothetical protein
MGRNMMFRHAQRMSTARFALSRLSELTQSFHWRQSRYGVMEELSALKSTKPGLKPHPLSDTKPKNLSQERAKAFGDANSTPNTWIYCVVNLFLIL